MQHLCTKAVLNWNRGEKIHPSITIHVNYCFLLLSFDSSLSLLSLMVQFSHVRSPRGSGTNMADQPLSKEQKRGADEKEINKGTNRPSLEIIPAISGRKQSTKSSFTGKDSPSQSDFTKLYPWVTIPRTSLDRRSTERVKEIKFLDLYKLIYSKTRAISVKPTFRRPRTSHYFEKNTWT